MKPPANADVKNSQNTDDNLNIIKNTEKSPGNLKKFAFTQTPVKYHHLTMV